MDKKSAFSSLEKHEKLNKLLWWANDTIFPTPEKYNINNYVNRLVSSLEFSPLEKEHLKDYIVLKTRNKVNEITKGGLDEK